MRAVHEAGGVKGEQRVKALRRDRKRAGILGEGMFGRKRWRGGFPVGAGGGGGLLRARRNEQADVLDGEGDVFEHEISVPGVGGAEGDVDEYLERLFRGVDGLPEEEFEGYCQPLGM